MLNIKAIEKLLKVDTETAKKVLEHMEIYSDLHFSSCSTRAFNKAAKEAFAEM